ncbi:putative translation elongation factor EF1B/ribosomal protein S6 [Helianthus annuus]|nr:putative translation elongation factor EF1B/ribosomal protein S6 [Helianthus annuus]
MKRTRASQLGLTLRDRYKRKSLNHACLINELHFFVLFRRLKHWVFLMLAVKGGGISGDYKSNWCNSAWYAQGLAETKTEKEKKAAEDRAAAVKASRKKKESGKSSVLMDIKPWDDETDMQNLEEAVRSVQMEGLLWGACTKIGAVGYGIKKLQIMLTIVDDLVSVDMLFEEHLTVEPINEVYQHLYYDAVSVVLWSCFNHCCVDVRLATDFMSDYVCSDF